MDAGDGNLTADTTTATTEPEKPPVVFVSYDRDDAAATERAHWLSAKLLYSGVDITLDTYVPEPPEGWMVWSERMMRAADRVLLLCTAGYRAQWDKTAPHGEGLTGKYEAVLARSLLREDDTRNVRFTPVHVGHDGRGHIPTALAGEWRSFDVDDDAAYGDLLKHIDGQALVEPPPDRHLAAHRSPGRRRSERPARPRRARPAGHTQPRHAAHRALRRRPLRAPRAGARRAGRLGARR